jgi:predicted hydrocarbon binding protein
MFTSRDCKFCPEIERIVRKFVGSNIGAKVNITTIDVDLSPDIAERYKIHQLPTVVMGNEAILSGYMSEEDIRDRLWSKIFQKALTRDSSFEKRKETIFVLLNNVIDSITRKRLIRPTIGDYTHLGALQISNMSLLALDKLAAIILYDAGKMHGLLGLGQMMVSTLNPEIFKKIIVSARFNEVIKGIVMLLSDNELFPLHIAEGAEILNLNDSTALIRVFGSAFAVASPKIGEPLCWSLAGEISGWIQSILGKIVKTTEISCWGLGQNYCDFSIELVENEKAAVISIDSTKDKNELQERRTTFQSTLMEMAENYQDSLFFKKRLRPKYGDYIHISVVQNSLMSLKLMDSFLGMILYSAGSTYGLSGPGKDIIQNLISEKKIEQPMELETALELIVGELKHPTTLLARQHSFVTYSIVEKESAGHITISENVYASGAGNVNEYFCDFTAGYINGRLRLLLVDEIVVKEVACHGSGDQVCKFEVTVV